MAPTLDMLRNTHHQQWIAINLVKQVVENIKEARHIFLLLFLVVLLRFDQIGLNKLVHEQYFRIRTLDFETLWPLKWDDYFVFSVDFYVITRFVKNIMSF